MTDLEGSPAWKEATPWALAIPPPPEWLSRAACAAHDDPTLWDAGANHEGRDRRSQQAIAICRSCPVKRPCLQRAYEPVPAMFIVRGAASSITGGSPDPDARWIESDHGRDSAETGIWGGTSPAQRRAVRHLPLELRIETLLKEVESASEPDLAGPEKVERPRRLRARTPGRPRGRGGRPRYALEALALGIVAAAPGRFTRKELSRRLGVRRQVAVLVVGDLIRHGRLVPDQARARLRVPDENVQVEGVPAAPA